LNLFNQHIVTDRNNTLSTINFSTINPAYGLITQAQADACTTAHNTQPCLIASYQKFQVSGAPLIAAASQLAANRYPLYNLANSFQGPRTVRFGFRFLF
jgi:hypothetical protein